MSTYLEDLIGGAFGDTVGDPIVTGLILIGWTAAFLMMQNTRIDAKVVVLTPMLLLSLIFIPFLGVLIAVGLGGLIYMALIKFTNR
jgi:hypothetical protein